MKRLTIILSAFLAITLSVAVFRITYQVDALEKQLLSLNKEILDEQETIHILNAEWSHLNDPERLYRLTKRFLGLEQMRGAQIINMDKLDDPIFKATPAPEIQPVNVER